jgi:hypothetical protein
MKSPVAHAWVVVTRPGAFIRTDPAFNCRGRDGALPPSHFSQLKLKNWGPLAIPKPAHFLA